ncbi:sarcoplasmic reticulum histidine-rich calcium-binding protein-like [Macrobrachium nipponense]|uniref:sarcoplasmic reticulum histidine-rich calcium-binding protein-like n=1 Tax=Macrobrachium nipponense TaxID=159736 RepID=UPI0030C7E412
MFLPGHLTTIVWLTSTYLSVCEGSPAEDLQQLTYNEGGDKLPYGGAERRYGNSSPQQQRTYSQIPHHRSRPHKSHGQPNTTHPHAFKLHLVKRHDLNGIPVDDNYPHFTEERPNFQAVEERADGLTKRKRGDGRKRKKKEERKGHRKAQGNSGWGSDVDDVLAALVGYSKDPSLWRFVHSVVAELDYSKQASNSSPPSGVRRHYSVNHFSSWTPKDMDTSDTKGKPEEQNDGRILFTRIDGGSTADYGGSGGERMDRGDGRERNDRGDGEESLRDENSQESHERLRLKSAGNSSYHAPPTSKENAPPPVSRFAHQNSQEQFRASFVDLEQPRESPAIASSTKVVGSSGMRPTHTPHFIFHKVYIDTNYDPHTRQPYHRPVLAVKAVAGEKTKASVLSKDTENGLPDTMETLAYQLPDDDTSRELPDKLEDLLLRQHRKDQEMDGDEEQDKMEEEEEEEEEDGREEGMNDEMEEENDGEEEGEEEEEAEEEGENDKGKQNQQYSRTLSKPLYRRGKDKEFLRRELQKDWSEDDDRALEDSFDSEGWRDVSNRRHNRRHFLHRLRQLQSFESQLKFLRRWQERLLRKRNQWPPYYHMAMT